MKVMKKGESTMKYYIKITNTETNESMITNTPKFTSKKKAQEWAEAFDKSIKAKSKSEVVIK